MKKDVAVEKFNRFVKSKNLRSTSQRSLIVDEFLNMGEHISSEELYDRLKKMDPTIGQATVYRTLKLLVESNIALQMDFGDGVLRFEINDESKHHDHLICESCGLKLEVIDPRIEALQSELANHHGFTLNRHRLYLFGLCKNCKKK